MKTFSIHVISLIVTRWYYWYASSVNCTNDSWKLTEIFKFWHYFLFFLIVWPLRSFNRVVCTIPPVCRLLYNVGKFDKCIKIRSNVSLDTLKGLLNCSGKKPGNICSKYSLLLSSLSLQKEVLNPDHELKKAEYGLKISP